MLIPFTEVEGMGWRFRRFAFILILLITPQLALGNSCSESLSKKVPLKTAGFTLPELLVSIGVVAVLVGITIPALSKSRAAAREVICQSNLRQNLISTKVYENDYKVLPVHQINNNPPNSTASVDLGRALEIRESGKKAWNCPEDRGFVASDGETYFYSYGYFGLTAMVNQRPPAIFIPLNAQRRYEREANYELYYRLPLYMDARHFHRSRRGAPHYEGGRQNAVWWDGTVKPMPLQPEGPPPPLP